MEATTQRTGNSSVYRSLPSLSQGIALRAWLGDVQGPPPHSGPLSSRTPGTRFPLPLSEPPSVWGAGRCAHPWVGKGLVLGHMGLLSTWMVERLTPQMTTEAETLNMIIR